MANLAATPVFTPVGGNVPAGQKLTITDATKGAVIYDTTNGTTPTTGSTKYTKAIPVAKSETEAAASGVANGVVSSAGYTIK